MKNQLHTPGEVLPGKSYSLWIDMKVNGWGLVAAMVTFLSDLFTHPSLLTNEQNWPILARVTLKLIPAFFLWLWVRNVRRWIRRMDELHRGITLEACLFATTTTLITVILWHRLSKAGLLQAILQPSAAPRGSWDFRQLAHVDLAYLPLTFSIFCCFWWLGFLLVNRRYQ